jgi:hypothetical protein
MDKKEEKVSKAEVKPEAKPEAKAEKVETKPEKKKEDKKEETPAEPQSDFDAGETPVALGAKARQMKEQLASQPKVKVFIPLSHGEKQGATQPVILNGYPMYVRKGQQVEVPEAVAEVLEMKLKHKVDVENHPSRTDGNRDIKMTPYGN